MQEDVEMRSVTLVVKGVKITASTLRAAFRKFLNEIKKRVNSQKENIPHGKQTVKQLAEQNAGMTNIEITDSNIKAFERVARKYGVDYALKRDDTGSTPKHFVFFKARDSDALTAAFTEFTAQSVKRERRPSILTQLQKYMALARTNRIDRVKNKDKELTR